MGVDSGLFLYLDQQCCADIKNALSLSTLFVGVDGNENESNESYLLVKDIQVKLNNLLSKIHAFLSLFRVSSTLDDDS